MTSSPGIRARKRAATERAILDAGRTQLAHVGAAALSLRAVARELDLASSAVYRYVESRDELLTLLIVESFTGLADAVEPSASGTASPVERWIATAGAMRAWALQRPHEWALLYGSPVPDYAAPPERTNAAGTRVMLLLLDLVEEHRPRRTPPAPAVQAVSVAEAWLADPVLAGRRITASRLLAALDAWTLVVGAISSEVFGHLGPLPDPAALFDATARRSAQIAMP